MRQPFLYICLGPTASGKESTALAAAAMLDGEIISVDSMKIYRTLDIGTAKASATVRAGISHHCLDLVDPQEDFSVGRFVTAAEEAITDIVARGKTPILSGGTALYYKGLLDGLFDAPPSDAAVRESLKAEAATHGNHWLHEKLQAVDPRAAGKLHPHDLRRTVRALEVYTLTGKPISAWQNEWQGFYEEDAKQAAPFSRYPHAMVWLDWPREVLHTRIHQRIDRMMEQGLEAEARRVWEMRDTLARTPLQAVGYKEFFPYFAGEATREASIELLRRNTRRLAKSQVTWFRKFPAVRIEPTDDQSADALAAQVCSIWQEQYTLYKEKAEQ